MLEIEYTGFEPQAGTEGRPPLSLDSLLIHNPQLAFFARMQGYAMQRAGVRHKDLLLIEPSEYYANDSLVLVFADGQALIRRWQRTGQGGLFVPSDDKLPTIPYDDSCIIRGQVIASITLHTRPRFMLPEVVS